MAYDFNSLTKQADEATNRDKFYTDFEDVDPNKLHQITELTNWMRTKAKGSDVREVIAQLFDRTWLESIKEGNANMEVAQARGTHPNLRSRLDESDKKQKQTTAQLAEKANKDEVTNVMTPKGNIAYASLPMTGNSVGWYYYCPDGDGAHGAGNYVWNGTSWFFGGTGDEGYNLLKKDIDELENFVFEREDINFSEELTLKACIQSDGTWTVSNVLSSKVIKRINKRDKLFVRANSKKGAIVSFLKTLPTNKIETGEEADFCESTPSRFIIPKSTSKIFDIPINCRAIVFSEYATSINEESNIPSLSYLYLNAIDERSENINIVLKDFLGTEIVDIKRRREFYSTVIDNALINVNDSTGLSINDVTWLRTENIRAYKIDVLACSKISFPTIKSTAGRGCVFTNSDDVVIGGYVNSELPSGTIVNIDVPNGANYFYLFVNKTWENDWYFASIKRPINYNFTKPTNCNFTKPKLSDIEKNKIVSLCSDYYEKRSDFVYGGWYRNQYASKNTALDGNNKFYLNCGNFAQMIWMGRSASDFIADSYTNIINTEFDFGYYFDFAYHKKAYGVFKNPQGSTDSEKYYTFQKPNESNGYSYNTQYAEYSKKQEWRWYMAAADLAYELYNMGCEVPRDELEVGDMIFYRDADYDGMSTETQLNFRNISHVAIVVDTNYDGKGHMRCIECTDKTTPTIAYCSISENDMQNALRSVFYEQRIVMVARHPHAFGLGGNVPTNIISI